MLFVCIIYCTVAMAIYLYIFFINIIICCLYVLYIVLSLWLYHNSSSNTTFHVSLCTRDSFLSAVCSHFNASIDQNLLYNLSKKETIYQSKAFKYYKKLNKELLLKKHTGY